MQVFTAMKALLTLSVALILIGCGSQTGEWKAQLADRLTQAQSSINKLDRNLNEGGIRNALLLKTYAEILAQQDQELSSVAQLLAQDANWDGPMANSLKERLQQANDEAFLVIDKGEASVNELLGELDAIIDASSPVLFGLMLTDPINVIADMSNGKLARIESMSQRAGMKANKEQDFGKGSQLVGNPSYGRWQQGISGQSIWAWYGMYSLFSRFSNGPIQYGNWASNRGYSYYSDHGRDYYTSRDQRRNQSAVQSATQKKFKQDGRAFNSPYAKKRTGGATTGAVTKRAINTNRSFSQRRTKSRSNNFSSQRSSSYKTSRSFGGGK